MLKPETLATMFAPQYQADARLPGLGLAFFRGTAGDHAVVEHQGIVPAFASQIALAPDDGLALVALTNGTKNGGFWLPLETDGSFATCSASRTRIRTDVPQHPETWADLCGWYSLPGPVTDLRARLHRRRRGGLRPWGASPLALPEPRRRPSTRECHCILITPRIRGCSGPSYPGSTSPSRSSSAVTRGRDRRRSTSA